MKDAYFEVCERFFFVFENNYAVNVFYTFSILRKVVLQVQYITTNDNHIYNFMEVKKAVWGPSL